MRIQMKKGTPECDIHNDFYLIHQNFGEPEEKQLYWDGLVDEVNKMAEKYKGTPLEDMSARMLVGIMLYLDGKYRGKQYVTQAQMIASVVTQKRSKEEVQEIIEVLRKWVEDGQDV